MWTIETICKGLHERQDEECVGGVVLAPGLAAALDAASPGRVKRDASLSRIGRWRIGGDAAILVEPDTAASAVATLRVLADLGAPWVVIGDGANILFDSAGYHGVVVRIGPALGRIDIDSVGGMPA
jgi:UDP-N-acetylmuramate dehydrogenase